MSGNPGFNQNIAYDVTQGADGLAYGGQLMMGNDQGQIPGMGSFDQNMTYMGMTNMGG